MANILTTSKRATLTALILTAFTFGLFFSGYRDITYAPALIALLLAAILASAAWRAPILPVSTPAILLYALWLYITLSLAWSQVPFASLVTWLILTALPLTFYALSAPNDRTLQKFTIPTFFIALSILGAWGVIQILFLPKIYGARAHHPFLDANNLAALLDLGLLPTIALLLRGHEKRGVQYVTALAAALMFAGVTATQSRGGLLCALAGCVVLVWTMRRNVRERPQTAAALIICGIAIFALLQIPSHAAAVIGLTKLINPVEDVDSFARIAIWRGTLRLIAAHPFGGTGFGTFYLFYPSVRPPITDNSSGNWAHNDPLQLWAECGILAPLLFYGFAAAVAWRTRQALNAAPHDSRDRALIAGLSCGLLSVWLHAHIEFEIYLLPTLIAAGVWLAAWHSLTIEILADGATHLLAANAKQKTILIATVILVALPLTAITASTAAGQYFYRRAQDQLSISQINGFTADIARAERYGPGSFIDPQVAMAGFYIDFLSRKSAFLSDTDRQKMFTAASDMLASAEKFSPAWAEIDRKRALLYLTATPQQMPDAKQKAEAALRLAVQKNPTNFPARADLSRLLLSEGHADDAETVLQTGLHYPHSAEVAGEYSAQIKVIAPLALMQAKYRQSHP